MKLRKGRIVIAIVFILAVLVGFYLLNKKPKNEVNNLGSKIYEKYQVVTLSDINSDYDLNGTNLKSSLIQVDYSEIQTLEEIESLDGETDLFAYIILENGKVYVSKIEYKDSVNPVISTLENDKEVEAITLLDSEILEDKLSVLAFDSRYNENVEIETTLSHDISVAQKESFDLVISATDGTNEVNKTIKVNVEKTPEVSVEKPSNQNNSNVNLITGDLNRINILVNKKNNLPSDFVPKLVEIPSQYAVSEGYRAHPEATEAFIDMVDAMYQETGLWMSVTSSYRDYSFQTRLYNNALSSMGFEKASMLSAKPGASEHQTGLAIDVVAGGVSMYDFGTTEQSKWVDTNAHKFGFVVRYQEAFINETGYNAEPWHLRFLGVELAKSLHDANVSYESFLN